MNDALPNSSALDEETARAEVYGLLALLYYAPPTATQGGYMEEPWRTLVGVARTLTDEQIAEEYDALFGGVGKPEVYLFGSHYLSGYLNEKPLARLRNDLAALGLTRGDEMPETEDHISFLCEVMRFLIAGDDVAVANLTRQREFFTLHVQPWTDGLCDATSAHPKARFYASLAGFTRAFMQVEAMGFDMLD